mmetsp:Transcript_28860/g.42748  ORF Transcript_28860/g.42748 Transcript_28860/m.42748 type:complete len:290 (+) Transcript_28860:42-911(+)|eukprot:CAMPEP_0195518604 /NCGR_PEP_ID=MMETSP0794_2-20130614/13299_1 /TAXON_ID=515487 /ORGANISM="Stephanopyxis turris, Strain CCMP 815" /LENGTH=289 /DNA_ID=CAMNT_0040647611 /DNA_START=33 /DNA_END=902 /DNA_ORIENTATION=+
MVKSIPVLLCFLASIASHVTASTEDYDASSYEDENLTNVYFGAGCFWHVQHEFVMAEMRLLRRNNEELTSFTGYAGGKSSDSEGRVCYHNLAGVADYGKLGHGEVVGMTIPEASIGDFSLEYFNLFTNGERADPQDRGGEYRSLIGLPGGTDHPSYSDVEAAASAVGMQLLAGEGNEPDTLEAKTVYVYDTITFPFYQAEVYHQFHNDFQSAAYGEEYNNLAHEAFEDGRLKITGCPDSVWLTKMKLTKAEVIMICGGGIAIVLIIFVTWRSYFPTRARTKNKQWTLIP